MEKRKFYQNWWFWLCIVILTLIIGIVAIIIAGFSVATSGINEVAISIQKIDYEATLYSSAGGNTIIIEIPNYTVESKKEKKESIINTIKNYANNNGILSNYSKLIIITKINSDEKKDDFYCAETYNLPNAIEISNEKRFYTYLKEQELSQAIENQDEDTEYKNESINNQQQISNKNTSKNSDKNTSIDQQKNTKNTINNTKENTISAKLDSNTSQQEPASEIKEDSEQEQQKQEIQSDIKQPESTDKTKETVVTTGQQNALKQAQNYLTIMPFSYNGILQQLKYEGYSNNDAKYGADNCGADWNEQATKKAKNYLDIMAFSKEGLIEQLKFDGFTSSQAEYGAKSVGY